MRIDGKKKHVSRAVFAATLLDVYDFDLEIRVNGKYERENGSGLTCIGPNKFRMDLQDNLDYEGLTVVIAHEMVHLKQYVTGDLIDSDDDTTIWKGQEYQHPEFLSDEYFLAPWEMEARALEAWIAHRWENRKNELH